METKKRRKATPLYILFISGPTASGKTDFSLDLAKNLDGAEIINADIGQFYKPFSIGTAKPDWQSMPVPHHLFDIVNKPKDFNVVSYKNVLVEKAQEIWNSGNLPIVVGGSFFYIRSLFFSPNGEGGLSEDRFEPGATPPRDEEKCPDMSLWERLYEVDPIRARAIHSGDTYRIKRALAIWENTGKKPSEQEPEFKAEFHARILFLDLPRELLFERINKRTELMMGASANWLDEVQALRGTEWEDFLKQKKLIGYPEIFLWFENGAQIEQIPVLIAQIQQKTRNYAKRQVTFWKKFRTLLEGCAEPRYLCKTETVHEINTSVVEGVASRVGDDLREVARLAVQSEKELS